MINKKGNFRSSGFASGNLIEECLDNLLRLKAASEQQLQANLSEDQREYIVNETKKHVASIVQGNQCVGSKEFLAIFNITCMVPFIRPSLQFLPPKEVEERRAQEAKRMRETGTREWHKKAT